MGATSDRMMKKLITLLLFCPVIIMAQKPFISNISPTHVEVGQTVSISGSNLSTATAVYFGGMEATVTSNTDNLIEATVPAGATNSSIYVINAGGIAQSSKQFYISFVGSDITNYDAEYTQTTNEKSASDLCMCDLNGDGKNDIVIVHNIQTTNDTQNEVSVFINNSTGTDPFSGSEFNLSQLNVSSNGSGFYSVACADLDNDGDNDLAFSSNLGTNAADVFVLAGDGSGTFSTTPTTTKTLLNTSGGDQRLPGSIAAADLDGDGLLDLAVGNRTDGTFHLFRNTGSLAFANAVEITATSESTGLLKVADFNNDGYQDIATLPFRQSSTSIHLFKNTSTINNFNFTFEQTISNGGQTSDIETGDLDDDGLLDIVVASNVTGEISTFLNQSSGGSISFGSETSISTTGSAAFGVNLGDINGDGALDIAASNGVGNIYVFENDGAGSFSNEQVLTTGASTQSIMVGDLNGDAKPDMAYSQDVQTNGPFGNLGVILNRNCVTPILSPTPGGGGVFCSNPETFTLTATASPEATYDWTVTGNTNAGGNSFSTGTTNSATFDLASNSTTTIRVTINSADGFCTTEFDEEIYTIAASVTGDPTINVSQAGVLCVGDNVTLSTAASYTNYFWTLPDGSTSTSATIVLNPVSVANAGEYSVRVQNSGSCSSSEVSQTIEVSEVPGFEILNNDGDDFCAGTSITMEVPDFSSDYTYQWVRDGSTNLGTSATQVVSQSGDYTVVITEQAASACTYTTPVYQVNAISEPVSAINGPTETCVGIETTFSAASTGQSGFTLTYNWLVDGNPVTPTDPTQLLTTFTATGAHTVTLTTAYDPAEVDACSDVTVFNVTVSDAPTISFDVTDGTRKCPSDSILITPTLSSSTATSTTWTLRNAFDNSFISDTTRNELFVFNGYTPQSVDSVYAVITVTNDIGCQFTDSLSIRNFDNSNLAIDEGVNSTRDTTINSVTYPLIELTDANFVELNASGGSDYTWTTGAGSPDNFDNPNEATTTFFPSQPLTLVTLSGTDGNNCDETFTIAVFLDNFRPRKTFSPNGDGMNDCWEILNIGQLGTDAGCKVYVFDSRGRTILTKETFQAGDNCVWDGNFNNSPVPEGVYYFVMKCENSNSTKSGSILLAR